MYRNLAIALGLEPAYRRTQLWRDIKERIVDLADNKQVQLIWIIDEAQNLEAQFFSDFPAFLNFAFGCQRSHDGCGFVGLPNLAYRIDRTANVALASRLHVRVHLPTDTESCRLRGAGETWLCRGRLPTDLVVRFRP